MENAEFIRHALADDSGMIAGMMGMHAQFTISDETMELAAANKPDEVGYHIHVAEGIEDLHHCLKHYGKRIVDRLMDHGILGEKTLLGHCIYINPHEMDLIKETDTMVVHNPESNMGNACGCPADHGTGAPGDPDRSWDRWLYPRHDGILGKWPTSCTSTTSAIPMRHGARVPQMLFENNAKIAGRYFKQELGRAERGCGRGCDHRGL